MTLTFDLWHNIIMNKLIDSGDFADLFLDNGGQWCYYVLLYFGVCVCFLSFCFGMCLYFCSSSCSYSSISFVFFIFAALCENRLSLSLSLSLYIYIYIYIYINWWARWWTIPVPTLAILVSIVLILSCEQTKSWRRINAILTRLPIVFKYRSDTERVACIKCTREVDLSYLTNMI